MTEAAFLDGRIMGDLLVRRLNCALVLEAQTLTPDGQGGSTRAWTTVFSVDGAVEPLSGEERLQAGQLNAAWTTRILIPYQTGVDPTMRVRYGTRLFQIRSVGDYSEQHLLLELMCEEAIPKP